MPYHSTTKYTYRGRRQRGSNIKPKFITRTNVGPFRPMPGTSKYSLGQFGKQGMIKVTDRTCGVLQVKDVDQFAAYGWKLNDLPDYAQYVNCFDQYRLDYVVTKLLFNQNLASVNTGTSTSTILPNMFYAADYDDNTTPTSTGQLWAYNNMQVARLDKPVTIYIQPRCTDALYGAGVFSSYGIANKGKWIDCASPAVLHYGLKWAINGSAAGGIGSNTIGYLTVMFEFHVTFRSTR